MCISETLFLFALKWFKLSDSHRKYGSTVMIVFAKYFNTLGTAQSPTWVLGHLTIPVLLLRKLSLCG